MAREMEKKDRGTSAAGSLCPPEMSCISICVFFDVALSAFTYVMGETEWRAGGLTAWGSIMIRDIWEAFTARGRREVNRAYLHMMLHCLFAHLWKKVRIRKKAAAKTLGISREDGENGKKDLTDILWDLACDISVESIIDGLALHCVKKAYIQGTGENLYASLRKKRKTLNAEGVFEELVEMGPSLETGPFLGKGVFTVTITDSGKEAGRILPARDRRKNWEDIRDRMETEMETFGQDMAQGTGRSEGTD